MLDTVPDTVLKDPAFYAWAMVMGGSDQSTIDVEQFIGRKLKMGDRSMG